MLTVCMVALIGAPRCVSTVLAGRRARLQLCGDRARTVARPTSTPLSTSVPASAGAVVQPIGWSAGPDQVELRQVSRSDALQPDRRAPTGGAAVTEEAVRGRPARRGRPRAGRQHRRPRHGHGIRVGDGGDVAVEVALTVAGCPLRTQIESDVVTHVGAVPGVRTVSVDTGVDGRRPAEGGHGPGPAAGPETRPRSPTSPTPPGCSPSPRARAGSGKSSVTVNLAVALARRGLTVGVLDADIWGFSVPRLLGMDGDVEARDKKMVPLERTRRRRDAAGALHGLPGRRGAAPSCGGG